VSLGDSILRRKCPYEGGSAGDSISPHEGVSILTKFHGCREHHFAMIYSCTKWMSGSFRSSIFLRASGSKTCKLIQSAGCRRIIGTQVTFDV